MENFERLVIEKGGSVYIPNAHIRPELVFECGQAFRFFPKGDGYFGVAYGKPLFVKSHADGTLALFPTNRGEFESIWRDYFDFNTPYEEICLGFERDEVLSEAVKICGGMRLLNQAPFETLITFIISANNNMARIRRIVEAICKRAGSQIEFEGQLLYAFPTPEQLGQLEERDLVECGAGYRAKYIVQTTRAVLDGFSLEALEKKTYLEAKKVLCGLAGVGPKVADCILLFSLHKKNAFPADVWIKRVLRSLYHFVPQNDAHMMQYAREKFGEYGGIAQQYLFHYARSRKIL